jgi:hypothetical protein
MIATTISVLPIIYRLPVLFSGPVFCRAETVISYGTTAPYRYQLYMQWRVPFAANYYCSPPVRIQMHLTEIPFVAV